MNPSDNNEHLNHSRILLFLNKGHEKLHQIFRKRWSIYRVFEYPNDGKCQWKNSKENGQIIIKLCPSTIDPNFIKTLRNGKIEDWDITLSKIVIQNVTKALKNHGVFMNKKEDQFIYYLNKIRNEIVHGNFKLSDNQFSFYRAQLTNIFIKAGDKSSDIEALKKDLMKFGEPKNINNNNEKLMIVKAVAAGAPPIPSHRDTRIMDEKGLASTSVFIRNFNNENFPPHLNKVADSQAINNQVHSPHNVAMHPQFQIPQRPAHMLMKIQCITPPKIPSKDGKLKYYQKNNQNTKQQIIQEPPQFFLQLIGEQKLTSILANKKGFGSQLPKVNISAKEYGKREKLEQLESQEILCEKEADDEIQSKCYVSSLKNLYEQPSKQPQQQRNQIDKDQIKLQKIVKFEAEKIQTQQNDFNKELEAKINQKWKKMNNNNSTSNEGLCAKALFEFDQPEIDEIKFKVNNIITNIECTNKDWWWGKCNGRFGYFPANYVQMI